MMQGGPKKKKPASEDAGVAGAIRLTRGASISTYF